MEQTPSNQNTLKIGIVVLLAALALLSFLYYSSKTENAELQKALTGKVDELSITKTKLDSISVALDQKIAEVTSLGGNIEELEKIKAQLENDKRKLSSGASFSSKKYEAKIADYKKFLDEKDAYILQLKEENGMLVSQNLTLNEEKQVVITQNTSLLSTKDSLNKKVSEVSSEKEKLQNRVKVGSAISAVNVNVSALSSRGKERTGEVRNRRIDQLKITFMLPSNRLAESNNKEIFLRLMDPDGGVLNDMNKGGVLKIDSKEIGYSIKQNVLFTNNDQLVDMYYKKDMDFKSGKYTIEIFAEGNKIGTGSFLVK